MKWLMLFDMHIEAILSTPMRNDPDSTLNVCGLSTIPSYSLSNGEALT